MDGWTDRGGITTLFGIGCNAEAVDWAIIWCLNPKIHYFNKYYDDVTLNEGTET